MNYALQILAFSILNASLHDRKDLSSVDILSSLYVLLAEELYQLAPDAYLFDRKIREVCGLEQPLWFIRERYFVELYRSSEIEASTTSIQQNEFYELLISSKDISSPRELMEVLLSKLRELDPQLFQRLLNEGISL